MDPKDIQILIAICVGITSLMGTSFFVIRIVGKLVVKVNGASAKVDELKAMLWTSEGKQRFVDLHDCRFHREALEKTIERAIETAMLKMTSQIEKDMKDSIARLHTKMENIR